jgi:hypothetical protein
MKRMLVAFFGTIALLGLASVAPADVLEVPANGGDASGIGFFSGWKCPPNNAITIVVDGGAPLPVPSGVRRGDTAAVCSNDGRNGYISEFNFNLLGDGPHSVSVRQNGVQFAQAVFNVTTFGTTFLSGASGTYTLLNFPQGGQTTTVRWDQGTQNFIIVGTSGGGSGAQVRYRNQLTCDGSNFSSALTANGFLWTSFTGTNSPYLVVNRTSLGPFLQTSSTSCPNITYNLTLPISAGRRLVIVQSLIGGNPALSILDEGPSGLAADAADQTASDAADAAQPTLLATVPGFVSEATGTLGPAGPDD